VLERFTVLSKQDSRKRWTDDRLYVAFWSLIGRPLVDYINHPYEFGELSNSQNQAIIVLIKKKDNDERLIKIGGLYR